MIRGRGDLRALTARVRDTLQELRELGLAGTTFRVGHELRQRSGYAALRSSRAPAVPSVVSAAPAAWLPRLPFAPPVDVAAAMRERLPDEAVARLRAVAGDATVGRILCFGRWVGDYGDPIDWRLNPVTRQRWDNARHYSRALADGGRVGDIKLTWEAARFPQAFHLARAAAVAPAESERHAAALCGQIDSFLRDNPYPRGVHWNSGQEGVIRLMAWLFALATFSRAGADVGATAARVGAHAWLLGHHLERELEFARRAVYNNHLVAEAFGLWLVAWLLPSAPESGRWSKLGGAMFTAQAARQVYPDGAYINQSHNYHRVVLQDYLAAWCFARAAGTPPPDAWRAAMERSLDLLVAHQNPRDGRLPNYGSNDGSQPRVLSTCDFADFRPTLQALSVAVRGERIYPPGPWDEETAWMLGPAALEAPLRSPARTSISFGVTGYHVARGHDAANFGTLRCGTLRDRFSQIDMLHLDVWWRGLNVLVDPGSYLYNGPHAWHDHFLRTESHNTVALNGRDQMLHFRRFKTLYWTRAALLKFEDSGAFVLCTGEHYGYRRQPGGCVHRRSVLFAKDDLWIVADHVTGAGTHTARLHWLGGEFPWTYAAARARLQLATPEGEFSVAVVDARGQPLAGTVVAGQTEPPRGWLSRYYADKRAVPSLAVSVTTPTPFTLVSVLGAGTPEITCERGRFRVQSATADVTFTLQAGAIALEPEQGSHL